MVGENQALGRACLAVNKQQPCGKQKITVAGIDSNSSSELQPPRSPMVLSLHLYFILQGARRCGGREDLELDHKAI